ncbi:MAG: SBBP repeat-containing protein, partial [Acidimicrobiales bacterium]
MDADTTPMRYYKTGAWTIRALLAAFAAVFCLASPAGAWSFSEGAVAIHSNSSKGGVVSAVQVDSAGNIYGCGHFKGSGDVDPNPEVTVTASVSGANSSVISKYNPSGNLLWYLVLNADQDDMLLDCALSSGGDYLVVAGKFKGTMSFPGAPAITSGGGYDAYVALISTSTSTTSTTAPAGVVWGKTLGGAGTALATGVDFDSAGQIYVGGHFKDEVDINWGTGSADNQMSAGWEDVFLTKFAVDGSLQWSKTWGGSSNDIINSLAIDRSSNDIYVGGYLANISVDYDPGPGTVMIGGTQGNQDSWISKFNGAGDLQWAKSFGANGHDRIEGMDAASGFVYAAGYQYGTGGDWDTGSGTIQLGSGNSDDPFTIKLNSSGLTQWALSVGGPSSTEAGYNVT